MELQINEKKEIRRKFKKCFSIIDQEDYNSQKFLRTNQFDNILIIRKYGDIFKVDCFRRSEIVKYQKNNKQFCRPLGSSLPKINYIHLNIGEVECYFIENDIEFILESHHKIYYAEPSNIKLDCYTSNQDLYYIKICGGKNCLPKIFGPKERIQLEEPEVIQNLFSIPNIVLPGSSEGIRYGRDIIDEIPIERSESYYEEDDGIWYSQQIFSQLMNLTEQENYQAFLELFNREVPDNNKEYILNFRNIEERTLIEQARHNGNNELVNYLRSFLSE